MSDHFSPIGFRIANAEALAKTIDELSDALVEEFRQGRERHLRWTDSSGASLLVHTERNAVVCVTPFFTPSGGLTRWRVRTAAPREDASCSHCGGADCDLLGADEVVSRAAVQWVMFAPYRRWLSVDRTYELEIAAFAHKLRVFADDAAFARSKLEALASLKLASNAFLPIGMLGTTTNVSAAAQALLVGRVSLSEVRSNSRGGQFWRIRVGTLPGPLDVVATPDLGGPPPPSGSLAMVEGWLVGRPAEPPPRRGVLEMLRLKRW